MAAQLGNHYAVVLQQRLEGLTQISRRSPDIMQRHHQGSIPICGERQVNRGRK